MPNANVGGAYAPLGVEGGVERSLRNMQALANLLNGRGIPLTIVVYPWPNLLARNEGESRQVALWRDFCAVSCKNFINLFPIFFAHGNDYARFFIWGDVHFSAEGHQLVFKELGPVFS